MQALKFLASGLLNTAVGYGVFLVCLHGFGWSPAWSNTTGYGIALIQAFLLNRFFVFGKADAPGSSVLRFAIAFAIAFLLNQVVLWVMIRLGPPVELSQLVAMASYTVLFYLLNKHFVFKQQASPKPPPQEVPR